MKMFVSYVFTLPAEICNSFTISDTFTLRFPYQFFTAAIDIGFTASEGR